MICCHYHTTRGPQPQLRSWEMKLQIRYKMFSWVRKDKLEIHESINWKIDTKNMITSVQALSYLRA